MSSLSTSSSKQRPARRLIWKLALLLGPFVAWLGFPTALLYLFGEIGVSLDHVVHEQATHPGLVLYGTAFTEADKVYKLKSLQERTGARIITLGSSRVLEIRSEFFRTPEQFYNAGRGIYTLAQLDAFLKEVPASHPIDLIILGVDQWQLNDSWDPAAYQRHESPYRSGSENTLLTIQSQWSKVYDAIGQGKLRLGKLWSHGAGLAYGMRAICKEQGYRNDGSILSGEPHFLGRRDPGSEDCHFEETFRKIEKSEYHFVHGRNASLERIAVLAPFLEECQRRSIHVAAFLPPLAPTVYDKIRGAGDEYHYLTEIMPLLRPMFARYGASITDLTDAAALGASDAEFLDGYHASEKAGVRVLLALAEQDELVRKSVDRAYLQQLLSDSMNDFAVFREEPNH